MVHCRRLELSKYERILLVPSHQLGTELENTHQIIHGINATNVSLVVSTPTTPLENQLEMRLDDVQTTIASLVEVSKHHKRGRSKTECRTTHGRQDNSVPKRDKSSSSKGKSIRVTRPNTSNFKHCMRPNTHKMENCLFVKLAAKIVCSVRPQTR